MPTQFERRLAKIEGSPAFQKAKPKPRRFDDGVSDFAARSILADSALSYKHADLILGILDEELQGGPDDGLSWLSKALATHLGRMGLSRVTPSPPLLAVQRIYQGHGFTPGGVLRYVNDPEHIEALNRLRRLAGGIHREPVAPLVTDYVYWYGAHEGTADEARPFIDSFRVAID
jgi:hypothetical protein